MKRQTLAWSALLALAAGACSEQEPVTAPLLPPAPPENPAIVAAGWTFDVLGDERRILITPPTRGFDPALLADYFGVEAGSPDLSLLAGDVVEVLADNATLAFSAVGAFNPGQRRVTFDIAIRNRLTAVNLITPTFPPPPGGTTGPLIFPFETTLINVQNQGVTGGTGDGTYVIIETPNEGLVAPSVTWDGAPTNFFNDTACGPTDNDCYRYEPFASIVGGGTSAYRTIGFDADATVQQFRFRGIVAADLQDATPNVPPTVAFVGAPYSGTVPNAVTVTANATDLDTGGGVTQVLFDLDNDGAFEITRAATGTTFTATAPFTCTTAGSFPIAARAIDNRGGTTTTAAGPVVNCAFPPANASVDVQGPATAETGSNFVVNVVVSNTGVSPVNNVAVTVTRDVDATLVSAPGLSGTGATLTATIPSLAGGATVTYNITLTAEAITAPLPETNVTSATIASGDDTVAGDNTDSQSVTIQPLGNVLGVWVNAATGQPFPMATAAQGDPTLDQVAPAGATAILQTCTTFGDTQSYQGQLSGYGPYLLQVANAADLASVADGRAQPAGGRNSCANAAGTDVMDQFTESALGTPIGSQFRVVNVSISATPGVGAQGLAAYSFSSLVAGTIAPALAVSVLEDFNLNAVPPVTRIPRLIVQ